MTPRTSYTSLLLLLLCSSHAQSRENSEALRPELHFEPNVGQFAPAFRYVSHAPGHLVALGCGGNATYSLENRGGEFSSVKMNLEGMQGCPEGAPRDQQPSFTNYYVGEAPQEWNVGVPNYAGIRFSNVYAGVDMLWLARRSGVEYQFHLSPGSDPGLIRLRFEGASGIRLDGSGNLVIETAAGSLSQRAPSAYQWCYGKRKSIPAKFIITGNSIGFELADYDTRFPTVIDPLVAFSSYLGGSGWDAAYGIAIDGSSNIYITGDTASGDFPMTVYSPALRFGRDVFIVKLSADGSRVLYTTILSSKGQDSGRAIAVDASGNAYVAGVFGGDGFPGLSGSRSWAGLDDTFVARLDPSGRLVFATALGGSGEDMATGIAIDSAGAVYVSGYTNSVAFPTTAGAPQRAFAGGSYDSFLAKINISGNTVVYSTLLGGPGTDLANAVVVDASGQACIAGYTDSANLPVHNAVQPALSGFGDALVACLTPSGTAWSLLTYLGGRNTEQANGIAIDSSGTYVTGTTLSSDFPAKPGAAPATGHGDYDVFVVKLQMGTPALSYSMLIGGSGADTSNAIAVDSRGQAWVAGFTGSVNFPTTIGPGFSGGFDAFVAGVDNSGRAVVFSTLLGAGGDDRAFALAVDGGAAYLTGITVSGSFPVTTNAYQTVPGLGQNAFAAKVQTSDNQAPTAVSVNPASGSGAAQTFTFTFSDSDGAQDIDWVQVLIAPVSSGRVCNFQYSRGPNTLWLYNDDYSALIGPITPGQATTLQNSQCTINGIGSAATANGSTLAVTVSLVFKPAFVGAKTINLYAQDTAGASTGSWRPLGSWSVPGLTNQAPTAVSVNPASGSGAAQTFTFTFSDPNGAQDIDWLQVLIAPVSSGRVCNFQYSRGPNTLWLYNDDYSALIGPITPGQATTLQNSQCTINGIGSAATANGSTLAVTVSLVFKPAFVGAKTINLYAQDTAGASTGSWRPLGSWSVPGLTNQAPTAVSVNPASGSGAAQTFTFTFSDPNGAQDIDWLQVLIAPVSSGRVCNFQYSRGPNTLWLYNDDYSALIGPITPGQATTLQNSQCTINGIGSAATANGSTLAVTVSLVFKPAFVGAKTINLYAQDTAGASTGSWRPLGSWSVPGLTNQAPTAVSVNPASGSGAAQTFTFTFSDPNGAQDIDWLQVLIAPVSSGRVCNFQYSRGPNTLWLYNDDYSALIGPITPGQATTLQNSQCTINGIGSTATANGSTLAVTVSLVFKPAFVGAKTINLYAQDTAGASTGSWRPLGSWSVPGLTNQAPTAVSVNPASGSGAAQTFTFTFSDPNGAQDIDWLQVLIAPVSSGRVCNFQYSRGPNTLWLYNDDYSALIGPITPGQATTLQNSQCTINGIGSTATANGSTLAVTVSLVFKPAFVGAKTINLYAQDTAGASTGSWRPLGSWSVP